jgi:hypothetical protein
MGAQGKGMADMRVKNHHDKSSQNGPQKKHNILLIRPTKIISLGFPLLSPKGCAVELVSYNPLFCTGLLGRLFVESDDGKLVYHCWALQESDAKEKCQQVAAYCGGVWRTTSRKKSLFWV